MKTIVGGNRYNTEIDKPIASKQIGSFISDFGYIDETLYRTENGDWYLHGVVVGFNNTSAEISSSGEHIIPMNEIQARQWLKHTDNTAALNTYFKNDDDT